MKGPTLSKDYNSLQSELAGDLSAAANAVSLAGGSARKKMRLGKSDLRKMIPDDATLEVVAVNFTKLQMGEVICVSAGRTTAVRRFVKIKMTKNDTYLLTAYDGVEEKEVLPKSALIGKVVSVEARGRTYDPLKEENPLAKFWGRLTEYGTHKAFGVLG